MATLRITQAQLVDRTDLNKTAVSLLVNGRQDYTPEVIRDVAAALNVAAYELLMHPDDAMALRQLRRDAARVVSTGSRLDTVVGDPRTGTDG